MELHKALKNIVNLSGVSILKEQRLVNILADFNAYEDVPSAKFIIKTIIAEGYMEKLLANGKWDSECDKLIEVFISTTGSERANVQYLFSSIGYALDWLNSEPTLSLSTGISYISTPNQVVRSLKATVLPTSGKRMSKDDMFGYLLSIVEIDSSISSVCGFAINQVSFEIYNSREFRVICEISGTLKVRGCSLTVLLYDANGMIRNKNYYFVYNGNYNGYDVVSIQLDSTFSIAQISKIRICLTDVRQNI